jgi:hypothetical protein
MAQAVKVPRTTKTKKKSPATKKSLAELAAQRRRAAAERMRGMLGHDPTRSYTDELIAERRREARAEDLAEAEAAQARRRSAKR